MRLKSSGQKYSLKTSDMRWRDFVRADMVVEFVRYNIKNIIPVIVNKYQDVCCVWGAVERRSRKSRNRRRFSAISRLVVELTM